MLPQARIIFEPQTPGECQVIVLGGRPPLRSWLLDVASGRTVWAVDSGVDACMSAGITPHYVLGDFDSISEEGKTWLKHSNAEVERFQADKDRTDFQLCLNRAKGGLLVTGCWGGRFDHAFANVFSALWGLELGAKVLAFADESEILIPLAAEGQSAALELRLLSEVSAISLLPLSESCEGVDVRGTKWELDGTALVQGRPYAVSNVPEKGSEGKISVKIEKGAIGVYCFFEPSA
ncbi:MAG: thiamine diphosphokinase [Synergistaceae bacterium]|nr:thiamine diphosphokinase [Synergistaceae bacterium]